MRLQLPVASQGCGALTLQSCQTSTCWLSAFNICHKAEGLGGTSGEEHSTASPQSSFPAALAQESLP